MHRIYSREQFYNDWRYSLKKDFTKPSGEPIKYAHNGLRTWGSERYKIPFSKTPSGAAVNSDGSLIAVAVEDNIYIHDAVNFAQVLVCKGHVSNVGALAFQPGNPKVLVSSAKEVSALPSNPKVPASSAKEAPPPDPTNPKNPTIIVWDLDEQQAHPMIEASVALNIAREATETVAKSLLQAQTRVELSSKEEESLTSAIEPLLSRIVRTHNVANQRTLYGRLQENFQSKIFSPSGAYLIYLPGLRPRSGFIYNDAWDIKIYSMTTGEDVLTLSGHTDALTWTGFSLDESMIGTVSWDKSMRIWDVATGHQKYKFSAGGQNWTGGFSPDSQKFAGTCADGSYYIYSMSDGSLLVHQKSYTTHSSWMRALSWSADSKVVAVGEGHSLHDGPGRLFLYDVERKEVTQQRILSIEACVAAPENQKFLGNNLECNAVRFVDGGRKIVVLTSGDGGIETYDLETWKKWRFARPGVDVGIERDAKEEKKMEEDVDKGQQKEKEENVMVYGANRMTVWEDQKRRIFWIASMDGDAVRIWDVPMTKENDL
jgi:WD40 repeat protein